MNTSPETPSAVPSFEEAYARLEQILEEINHKNPSLETSLALYEEADGLISLCNQLLTHAEQKVEKILKNRSGSVQLDENQEPLSEEFSPDQEQLLTRETNTSRL